MEEKLLKEALKMRYEFYNIYHEKEKKWHDKYKEHELYETVIKSFDYDFKYIANVMPQLLNDYIDGK